MVTETDLKLGDGRTLHAYDTGADDAAGRLAVFWHHGSPNIGAPPEPLFSAADRLGIRWISYHPPGSGRGVGVRRRLRGRRRFGHRAVRAHGSFGRRFARPGVRRLASGTCP